MPFFLIAKIICVGFTLLPMPPMENHNMKRKEDFINDKRRVAYLSAIYNRIYRGQSVLIEGDYGVGKSRFLRLLRPKKLHAVWVETPIFAPALTVTIINVRHSRSTKLERQIRPVPAKVCSSAGSTRQQIATQDYEHAWKT